MEPLLSYIICTNPRSGSWLLAEGLESTGIAGRPREWFNEIDEEEERQRCGMPPLVGAMYASYLARIKQVGTSANGVFGLKLMYTQFAELPQKLSAIPDFRGILAENILAKVFPNVKHIWLTRHDKVRQAISHYRACQTDLWWQIQGAQPKKRSGTVEAPQFDAEAIAQFERLAIHHDLAWERYFQQASITPLTIVYEELTADYTGIIRRILHWLGISNAETILVPPPRLSKQADATTEEWISRYSESGKRSNLVPCESEFAIYSENWRQEISDNKSGKPSEGSIIEVPVGNGLPRAAATVEVSQADFHQGVTLAKQGQLDKAADIYEQVLCRQPDLAEAYNNLGIVRLKQGNLKAALAAYNEALRLKPDLEVARANRARVWLLQGDFARGWPEHERYCRSKDGVPRVFAQPRWQGESLEGRTILLYGEHGLGDTLQFIRYAPLVRQQGGVVLLEVQQPELAPLLCHCPGIDRVVPAGANLPDFDVQASLLSLPGLFHTTLETIPTDVPYLSAAADRVERWGKELQSLGGFRVGIAWQGNPSYPEDRHRSIPLKHFAALAAVPGVRLVSLQKGYGREQLPTLAQDWGVLDFGNQLDEVGGAFMDTAALMCHLDLVVTCDTSIAHLAGALAMPVWVALPTTSDWRWLLEREDSPWYPTVRLFRQKRLDDWNEVFNRIAQALKQYSAVPIREPLTDSGALRKRGRELCAQERYEEAIGCLRRALRLNPESAPTCNNLAVALTQQGQLAEAIRVCRQALRLRPDYAEAHHNLGEALQKQGKLVEARASYEEALRLKPDLAATRNSLGVILAAQGELQEACLHYREALRLQPSLEVAHHNLALALERLGDSREACRHYQEKLERRHDSSAAYLSLGDERVRQGRIAEAVANYRLALRLQPESAEVWMRLGRTLVQQGQREEAVGCFEAVLRLRPEDAESLQHLGDVLRHLGRMTEAENCYRRALRVQPYSVYLHNHLGITLLEQSRPTEAESCFRDSLAHKADHAPAHNNLGVALEQQGRLYEAIHAYQESIRLDPHCADTRKNLALARLLSGDFARGWPEYEWRWKCAKDGPRFFAQPRWDGSPLGGRTILLYAEQGLGDTLQFIRYASLVHRQGGVVLAEVQPALLPLLRRCPGVDRFLPFGSPLPDFDVQAPLLSLPSLLHTTLATVPADKPYLSADPALVERWQDELHSLDGFKIGIAWQGSSNYVGDKHRSIPLRHFAALSRLPGVRLVSLQKGHGQEQLTSVARDWNVLNLADRLDESSGAFMDTAAVMQHLDLVVTSDTAIAHLAGALAVPVWVMLPVARDWRWLLEREDSPWYPTMRLFRQKQWGDWDEVFHRVAQAVQARQTPSCTDEGNIP